MKRSIPAPARPGPGTRSGGPRVVPPIGPPPYSTAELMRKWRMTARECLGTSTASLVPIIAAHFLMWGGDPLFAAVALLLAGGLIARAWLLQKDLGRLLARLEHRNRTEE